MPYSSSGKDVPSYVPKSKRKQWAAVWNAIYNEHHDEARAFAGANAAIKKAIEGEYMSEMFQSTDGSVEKRIFCPLVKVDEAKREVWGIVTAEEPDKDGEVCDFESTVPYYKDMVSEMSKATDGANIFPLREMHGLSAVGKGISIDFRKDSKEVYMGFKVVDDNAWKKVKENVYTGFSQGGKYVKKWKVGDNIHYTAKPVEVSLVDVPCLTRAHYDLVRADGSVIKKSYSKGMMTMEQQVAVELAKAAGCKCGCENCKAGKCASCSAESKCNMSAKAVKYLVNKDGEQHLPYTNADGTPNHRLMGAAWAALHGGYRGNKYSGPDKSAAIRRLKQVYAREGMDTPSEKAAVIDEILKTTLHDAIQSRAFGMLNKGLYTVGRFAQIVEDLKYLWLSLEYEREQEGDESPVTDDVKESLQSFFDHLLAYTEEQIEEEREKISA